MSMAQFACAKDRGSAGVSSRIRKACSNLFAEQYALITVPKVMMLGQTPPEGSLTQPSKPKHWSGEQSGHSPSAWKSFCESRVKSQNEWMFS